MSDPSQTFQQAKAQLEWAPALANGAGTLALAGIVGNVPDPDTALSALTWPLVCFGAGLLLACTAPHVGVIVRRLHVRMDVAAQFNAEVFDVLIERMEAKGEYNETGHAQVRGQMRSDIEAAKEQLARLSTALDATMRLQDWPGRLNLGALGSCGLGFLTLLAGHAMGLLGLEAR